MIPIVEDFIRAMKGGDRRAAACHERYDEAALRAKKQALESFRERAGARGLGLSSAGSPARMAWYKANIDSFAPMLKHPREYRKFRFGHNIEIDTVQDIKAALDWHGEGGTLEDTCLDDGGQLRVYLCTRCWGSWGEDAARFGCGCPPAEWLTGHPDGILTLPPTLDRPEEMRVLFECKSAGSTSYRITTSKGYVDNTFGSLGQTEAYMRALDLDGCLRYVENKETSISAEFYEERRDEIWEAVKFNMAAALEKERPPLCSAEQVPMTECYGEPYGWTTDKQGEKLGLVCGYCDGKLHCFDDAVLHIESNKPVWRRAAEEAAG